MLYMQYGRFFLIWRGVRGVMPVKKMPCAAGASDRASWRNTLGRGPRTEEPLVRSGVGGGARVSLSIVTTMLPNDVVEIAPRGEIDVDTAHEIREAVSAVLTKGARPASS